MSSITRAERQVGTNRRRLTPLLLVPVLVLADQITKILIIRSIEPYSVGVSFFDGILRIIHTRNTAIAFSIGRNLPDGLRLGLFTFIPLLLLVLLLVYYVKSDDFTMLQRWAVAGIIGGGVGNLIDRILRPEGVVDFIDVKIFGFLGMERWPTFNVADSSVVVAGLLLLVSLFADLRGGDPQGRDSQHSNSQHSNSQHSNLRGRTTDRREENGGSPEVKRRER
jgi:signal peptidase II